jgi:glucosamine--fructose-6-phosphate aminotransferase (isomerizing)
MDRETIGKYTNTIMFNEINEEPKTIINTVHAISHQVSSAVDLIRDSKLVYVVGSGTSYHAGIVFQIGLLKQNIPSVAVRAPEFIHFIPKEGNVITVILISQSGESRDIIDSLKICKDRKYNTIGITNNGKSRLANETLLSIVTDAGEEKSLAATKSHIAQLTAIYLVLESIGSQNSINVSMQNCIDLSVSVSKIMKRYENILQISEKLSGRIVFLGNGYLHAEAMEGALKFEETANLITEAYPMGEYFHGPIQVLKENDTVIILRGSEELEFNRLVSKLKEYSVHIISIGSGENDTIRIPETNIDIFNVMLSIIPVQLLANFKTVGLGLNPDKPTHLNKIVK